MIYTHKLLNRTIVEHVVRKSRTKAQEPSTALLTTCQPSYEQTLTSPITGLPGNFYTRKTLFQNCNSESDNFSIFALSYTSRQLSLTNLTEKSCLSSTSLFFYTKFILITSPIFVKYFLVFSQFISTAQGFFGLLPRLHPS